MSHSRSIGSAIPVLVAAMTVVALAFASAMVYFETATMRVSRETEQMLANGVPSAERLTEARATLRKIDGALDQALLDLAEDHPPDFASIAGFRRQLDAELSDYRSLPYYRFEADLNRELDHELTQLDGQLDRVREQLANGNARAAQVLQNSDWRRQSDRADEAIRALIGFNIRHVGDHALRIDQIRARSSVIGFGVSAAALLLAAAATVLAARAVRRRSRLQEERAAELEIFSSRVAHDLMSPLTSVGLALELARASAHNEDVDRRLKRALAVLKRMREMVDGLLEFARAAGRPAPGARCDLAPVVQAVVDQTRSKAEEAGIRLELAEVPAVSVACAPGIVTVVLENLVNNAIKFMGDAPEKRITVAAELREGVVRVDVRDTGPGVTEDFAERAFEPWARGSHGVPGLGLGLATVKRLVVAYGGHVGLMRDGADTSFWFDLPRAPEPTMT